MNYPPYLTIEKKVGETPLQAAERLRIERGISDSVSLAYAGRLDPMAHGKLLILIGEECKKQTTYHHLDKKYEFEVLFGLRSDTGDVLGMIEECAVGTIEKNAIAGITKDLVGPIELAYPHFSSKTVDGKPLYLWTLEERLNEISIPTKRSRVYQLSCTGVREIPQDALFSSVRKKIATLPQVIEESKALGRDFRRKDVLSSWDVIEKTYTKKTFTIASFTCICSSGTYMRSLSERIAQKLGTCGLACDIHRSKIGTFWSPIKQYGLWIKSF